MFNDWNVSHILAIVCAVFLLGVAADEYRTYRQKARACEAIDTLATSLNRELAPDHKCRAYLRSEN